MDDNFGSEASDLSLEELKEEHSSRPPEIAEWLWCIEYVAKFVKEDIRCIIDLMNMGYEYSNDYGRRINEVLSLRILELIFDPSKNDATGIGVGASTSEPRVEFDLSMSNANVLRAILNEIPVSELRVGMPELSKFNVLPFIAHKNLCLPQCALEKLRDLSLMENQTSASSSMEANDPVFRDDRSVHMDTCEEEPRDEQQTHIGVEQNINENVKEIVVYEEDEPMHTNERDEDTASEPISNGSTTGETSHPSSGRLPEDARVKCTEDGTWLISESDDDDDDDELDMVKGQASRTRTENVCWKCGKEGSLLVCSRSECSSKIHKECLKCPFNVDEDGNFHCPVCWYDRAVTEYIDSQKMMSSAKRKLVELLPVLSAINKRHRFKRSETQTPLCLTAW
ncbi:unnamed protein product [Microthlaspi erraticum]|uniref:Zinc finger PHD-type domain-containing protein n=1 Tax=Microthlaspi erraticum TaxID=1685480 RepID=A0A6D2J3X0_9BRAS|nr:unnamed protein product [Microthlaspi erraticum]